MSDLTSIFNAIAGRGEKEMYFIQWLIAAAFHAFMRIFVEDFADVAEVISELGVYLRS